MAKHPFHSPVALGIVLLVPIALFTWLFARFFLNDLYLSDSDLYEYFLPVFLSPLRFWSSFEFSGLPVFADPGDFSFYPPNLLLGGVLGSWTALAMSAYVIAAWLTYAYVFSLTGSRWAAAISAAGYSLSETMMERLAHMGSVHAIAWLPLIALAVDRVRGERARRWIAAGALGVACCILAGHAQPALYALYCTGLYALVGLVVERAGVRQYLRIASMFALGGVLAAVKLLPALEASTLMARQEISFDRFVGRALTLPQTLSVFFPTVLHGDTRELPTYVGVATLLFALVALGRIGRNWRIAFWAGTCVIALLMGLGEATPVPWLAYHLPLYDNFRVGARHLFLFAFGAATLAGFGLAAIQARQVGARAVVAAIAILLTSMTAGAAVMRRFPAQFELETGLSTPGPGALSVLSLGVWLQLGIAFVASGLALWAWRARRSPAPAALVVLVLVADLLVALPYDLKSDGLDLTAIGAASVAPSVHAAEIGRDLLPAHRRALAIGGTQTELVVPAAFARLWRIPIAGGYGPMLLARYSDVAMMGTNGSVRPFILAPDDAALDLLAVRYLLVYDRDVAEPGTFERHGVTWAKPALGVPVGRPDCGFPYPRSTSIGLPPDLIVSEVALVTHLRCAEDVLQGTRVGAIRIVAGDKVVHESELRAGYETAEADLFEPDVRGHAKHQPATRFDDPDGDSVVTYYTRVTLPAPLRTDRLEFHAPKGGWMSIDRLTLIDDRGRAHPQSSPRLWLNDPARFREVRRFSTSRTTDRGADDTDEGEQPVTVVENRRAAPRAWFVADVVAAGDADALAAVHYGLLPDGQPFDHRGIALVDPGQLPPVTHFAPGQSTAQVMRIGDGEISVVASTAGGGFLVLSESHYPGWRARIDGNVVPVYRANVTLQGIVVPPGLHRIQFELVSTTFRAGVGLSSVALLVCAVLLLGRRGRSRPGGAERPRVS